MNNLICACSPFIEDMHVHNTCGSKLADETCVTFINFGQIREHLSDLKQESENIQEPWSQQQSTLNQMLLFQKFLQDVKMVDDMRSAMR